jgi:hypothetical protein
MTWNSGSKHALPKGEFHPGGTKMSDRKRKDWRELCAAVSNERDSTKLTLLIQELIVALDEQTGERASLRRPTK